MAHRDFTKGHPWSTVLTYGLPLSLGMASHALFNLVDLVMVGRLGPGAVAAVHVGSTINFLPMIIGNGIGVSTVAIASNLLGAGHVDRARTVSNRSHVLMLVAGVVFSLLGMALAGPLVRFQSGQGDVVREGREYLLILSGGTLTMFLLMQVTVSLRAAGDAAWPVALLIGSNVLNLVLNVLLIFGYEPLSIPAMGVAGSAWATVVARGAGGLLGLWVLTHRRHPLHLGIPRGGDWVDDARQLLWIGMPQSVQVVIRACAVIYLTRLADGLGGKEALGAVGVGTRLDTLVLFAAAGWGAAATATVGQCIGAVDPVRAHSLGRIAAICSGLLAGVVVVLFAVFARPILQLFVDYPRESTDPSYQAYLAAGHDYLRIAVLAHPFSAFCLALTGALNGSKVTLPPLLFDSVVFLLILVPVASYVENYNPSAGLPAIWWTVVCANVLLAIVYAVFFEGLHRIRSCGTVSNCRA